MVRKSIALVIATVLATGLTVAQSVDAMCGSPSVGFSPAAGEVATGTTWVFLPIDRWENTKPEETRAEIAGDVEVRSKELIDSRVEVVSLNNAFATVRIDVSFPEQAGDAAYEVLARGKTVGYVLSERAAQAKASMGGPVSLSNPKHVSDHGTCSYSELVTAVPSQSAAAYRIEWASSERDYRAGNRESIVVPRNMDVMRGQRDSAAEIDLGHLSCFGDTVPHEKLAKGVFVGVTALVNGNEATPDDPIEVRADESGLVFAQLGEEEWICGTGRLMLQQEREREAAEAAAALIEPPGPLPVRVAVIALLIGMFTGMFLGGTLTRRTLTFLDAHSIPQLAVVFAAIPAALSRTAVESSALGSAAVEVGVFSFALATAFSVIAVLAQRNR